MVAEEKCGIRVFFHSTRFLILTLATACLTFCLANPVILNFTVICMDDIVNINSTETHWLHDPSLRNLLFSATAIGNLLGTFPTTYLLQRFGTRNLFMIYGLTSAVATSIFPLAVETNIYAFIFLIRIFQGFAMAFTQPASGAVCCAWSPLKEYSMYISILCTHFQFAAIFTMPVSSAFCVSSIGWRGVFYFQAAITFAVFALFRYFYEDDPADHSMVSHKELDSITEGREEEVKGGPVPYLAILRSPTILGTFFSIIGGVLGFQILYLFGPIYLNKILHFEVTSTGFATALPYILSALVKLIAGPLSDRTTCLSDRARILFFASVSQGFMAVCYIFLAMTSNAVLSQIMYTAAIVFSGLNVVGVVRCAQLVARQYTPFVLSVMNGILCIITLILPPVIAYLTRENTHQQWSMIFYTTVVIIFSSNILFVFTASSEAAPWTKADYSRSKSSDVENVKE